MTTVENSAAQADLSVFLATPAGKDPGQTYREALDTIVLAETLGYSHVWLAEAHFSSTIGLPSALTFLAAASQVSNRIRLGTAVVPLAFDNPLRLAETAAVVNGLSNGRLEFGVGKGNPRGFSTDAFKAFGLDEENRDELYARALEALKAALRDPIDAGGKQVAIYPPADDLLDRIWQATGSSVTAAAAGAAGDGLQLFRTVPEGIAGDVQSLLIDHYLGAFDATRGIPRIGISRSIVLASSRRAAIDSVRADFEARAQAHPIRPDGTDAASIEEYLTKGDVAFGSVADVVDALNGDAAVARSTNYLFNFPYTPGSSPALREALEVLAVEVYPRLRHEGASGPW
jgi:alkanesulfonate monooxygenase SsuD/methylene tetrahydromethanopterin reductase-like flavin-dependent oxidoreductase (luciferase family)